MKATLQKLSAYQPLSKNEAKQALMSIGRGEVSPSHTSAFLTTYMMRTITLAELTGFTEALLELCLRVPLNSEEIIDLCGTGGDGKDTFNISTAASFVVAGAGQKVAKHGNYGISSNCGSSTVMEFLGTRFTSDFDILQKQMETSGLCFLHAPLFHPAMKHVGPIRRELGLKTFFNMLGPLVNPAFPKKQLTGVFNLELARMYGYLSQASGRKLTIVHDLNGYDEVSLTGPVKVISPVKDMMVTPEELGLPRLKESDIVSGETVEESAAILTSVLQNKGTEAQKAVVLANAGLALALSGELEDWREGIRKARESMESGAAWKSFQAYISIQPPPQP
jgi:anthranilate phosphoribosyltransferase